jgi:hypothetical protein
MLSLRPSIADIDAVAAIAEPIRRNLRITVAYGELANAFARRVPGGANWCSFATWASRQAGCTIRREDVARAVERHLRRRLERQPLGRRLTRVPGLTVERVVRLAARVSVALPGIDRAADAVARGNRKVFDEIARHFARALDALESGSGSLDQVVAGLRPGAPPDGQDLLRQAFLNYQAAAAAGDAVARAQLAFLANIQIGLHEQTRLQPEIREAMDAALLDVADVRREVLRHLEALVPPALRVGLVATVNAIVDELAQEVRLVVRLAMTELLMTIGLPAGRLVRLGSDLTGPFPAPLQALTHADLVALVATFDPLPDSAAGSGAADWAVLEQRMRFIADFFRSAHVDASLHAAPFAAAALETIAAGRVPDASGLV